MKKIEFIIRTDLIRGKMAEKGYTIGRLAQEIPVSRKTLSDKLNSCSNEFKFWEMARIAEILELDEPGRYFFAQKLA